MVNVSNLIEYWIKPEVVLNSDREIAQKHLEAKETKGLLQKMNKVIFEINQFEELSNPKNTNGPQCQ